MIVTKMTQAVPKNDTPNDTQEDTEFLFQDTLKEYIHLFGGICNRDTGLSKSICKSFDLAKENLGLTDKQVNCFYLENYILNKKTIVQKIRGSRRKNQLKRSARVINDYLEMNQVRDLIEVSSEDPDLKHFLQECYIDFQIIHPKNTSIFTSPLSSMDMVHIESLHRCIGIGEASKVKVYEKK